MRERTERRDERECSRTEVPEGRAYGGRIVSLRREGGNARRRGKVGRGRVNVRFSRTGNRERSGRPSSSEAAALNDALPPLV